MSNEEYSWGFPDKEQASMVYRWFFAGNRLFLYNNKRYCAQCGEPQQVNDTWWLKYGLYR